MGLKRGSEEPAERLHKLEQALTFVQEGLVDLLEVLDLGDVFTTKAVAAQILERIRDIPELKERQEVQMSESVEDLLKFQPTALKSLAPMLHKLLEAIGSSDLEVAQGIAKQLEGLIKEEPFLDFTED